MPVPDVNRPATARVLCGSALIVMLASVPVAMSLATKRGFVLTKLAVGLPLAIVAGLAACWLYAREADGRASAWRPDSGALCATGLCVVAALAASGADDWLAAWLGGFFRLEGGIAWIAYAAAYFATSRWIRSGGNPVRLVDAIIVGSIAPAGYAIWQRTGLDFVSYSYGDANRSAGTLGNPVFMGAYLAMCLPLVLARIGMADSDGRRGALGSIGLLVLGGLAATGSRGAVIGALAALVLLACHRTRMSASRRWLIGMGGLLAVMAGAIAAINLTDAGRSIALASPATSRFVIDTEGHDPATRSIVGRFAAWSAADEAFRQASLWRKLGGYGPDVAHVQWYAHVPVSKIRAEDFRAEQVFDRVHADMLDVVMALGLAGVLLVAAMLGLALWRISVRAFGCSGRVAGACVVFGMAVASAGWMAGEASGTPAMRWSLAGGGFASGWLLAVCGFAWRATGEGAGSAPEDGKLAAGCGAALLAYWIDAQVGLPVFATRIPFFVLLAVATTPVIGTEGLDATPGHRILDHLGFPVACAAALMSFFPVFGSGQDPGAITSEWGRWVPLAALLVLGGSLYERMHEPRPRGRIPWMMACLIMCAGLAFARFQVALPSTETDWVRLRAVVEAMFPLAMWFSPFVIAWLADRAGLGHGRFQARTVFAAGLIGLACSAWPLWRLTAANVIGAGSIRVESTRIETRLNMLEAMLAWAPWEWQYRYAIVYEALPAASAEVFAGLPTPESISRLDRLVSLAESVARDGDIDGSKDPWRPFLIALPLQMRGLNALWRLDPDRVARASDQADALFARSHARFPVHPLILEQWLALKFDRGEFTAAAELIDRLESLIPNEPEPYMLRVQLGRRSGDAELVKRTVEAAKKALNDSKLAQVMNVVN